VTSPIYDQKSFRGRNDDVALNSATFTHALNANWTQLADVNFRVRFVVQESNNKSAAQTFKVQYQVAGGGYLPVTTGSAVKVVDSGNFTDDDATSQLLDGTGTFQAGVGDDLDNTLPTSGSITVPANGNTEIEITLQIDSSQVSNGQTVNLRVILSPSTVLNSYTSIPAITADVPSPMARGRTLPEIDEHFDAALGHDFRGYQAAPLAADVLPPTEQPAPELPEIDGAFEPYHPQYYEGQQSSPVEGTAVSVSWAWLQVPASVDFQAPREFPQVDESYDLPFDLESYGGWQERQFEEAAAEPQLPQPEAPAIDQGYDIDHAHDFAGWAAWQTPADIVEPYHLPETPIIDEVYDETAEHDFTGWQQPAQMVEDFQALPELPPTDEVFDESQGHDFQGVQAGPLSADAEVQDFQSLAELPEVDGTFDAAQGHTFDGWQTWQTPADVAVQPPVSSLPEFQPEQEADYSGWQAWQIPGDIAEPYHLPELTQVDESYDGTWQYDFAGWQTWQISADVQDFQALPELPQVDQSYDGTWLHDFQGWQTWLLPGDVVEPYHLPELPPTDDSFDAFAGHTFDGWQIGPLSADAAVEDFQPLPEFPIINEVYDVVYMYDGWQTFQTPADILWLVHAGARPSGSQAKAGAERSFDSSVSRDDDTNVRTR